MEDYEGLDPYGGPEIEQPAQDHPDFVAWLTRMDGDLELLARADVPALSALANPWTRDGLQVIARAALQRFPGEALSRLGADDVAVLNRMARGIGHIFATACEGRWRYAVGGSLAGIPDPPVPVVEMPSAPGWIDPAAPLFASLSLGSDAILIDAFDFAVADHIAWMQAGRPETQNRMASR